MTIKLAARRGRRTTALSVLIALAALIALVATAAPASASTVPASIPELAQGAGMGATPSPAVRRVQRALDRRGYNLGAPGVDGRFGPLTNAAVRRMQAENGLAVDGIVGKRTRKALGLAPRASRAQRRPQTAKHKQAKHKQSKPTPKATTPKAPAPLAAPKPAPAPTPTPTAGTRANTDDNPTSFWLIALGVLDAILALVLVLVVRSTRAAKRTPERPVSTEATPPAGADPATTTLEPLDEELYLEGHSEQAGDFRGRAVASTFINPEDRPERSETRYLVDDPRKAQPIWVGENEIERSTTRARPSPAWPASARSGARRRAWRPRSH